ncbi:DUF2946 family protein [Hyphococcus luteus]|uniref:DUF2946 domain-containing protein n=1 Tax=Hyphococcus luteus TaxID=2058213 RepID=A0A2S7K0F9_9PROT|nr:DUF2946 family protein [Marinicaulis flavus]PQA85956.1 hypothetical protein CW354_16350 [Marinicaulis flavus]
MFVERRSSTEGRAMTRGNAAVRLFLFAAFLAAALRAVVPAGYMFGADPETGRIAITICTGSGDGVYAAYLDPETGDITDHDGAPAPASNDAGQCPFASFSLHYTPGGQAVDLVVATFYARFDGWRVSSQDHYSQSASAPPPSRAPPFRA